MLTTGRIPRPVGELLAGVHRYYARLNGSLYLLTDAYPSFTGTSHPVELVIDSPTGWPGRREALRRAATVPATLTCNTALGIVVVPSAAAAWVAVLLTGRMPIRLHRTIAFGTSYHARSCAYLSFLTPEAPRVRERHISTGAIVPSGSGGV